MASFLWEGLVAIGTLALAVFTACLAWVTRRLAQTTSREVQAQFRPILVPAEGSFSATWPDEERKYEIHLRLRNVGAGPALRLTFQLGGGPWEEGKLPLSSYGGLTRSPEISVVAPGDEVGVELSASMDFFTGLGPAPTTPVRVMYSDMAGLAFATDIDWVIWKWLGQGEEPKRVRTVQVHDGIRREYYLGPDWSMDPLEIVSSTHRIGWGWSFARLHLFPWPGSPPTPLRRRIIETWRAIRPRRTQVFSQRVRWGLRVYKATLDRPVPARVPRWLHGLYKIARGIRWAMRAYWRIR